MTLIVVTGRPASGKTTLAHRLAAALGCPALCRDELENSIPTAPDRRLRTYDLFFTTIRLFLDHGVTHVAEAAFQHPNWARGLEPRLPLADTRIVRCQADPPTVLRRLEQRGKQPVLPPFDLIALAAPTLDVDTTDGYTPGFDAVVAFSRS